MQAYPPCQDELELRTTVPLFHMRLFANRMFAAVNMSGFLSSLAVIGIGLFASPNTTSIMNAAPAHERGAASGIRATFQNAATVLSIAVFFGILTTGLAARLPVIMARGLDPHSPDEHAKMV